MAEAEKPKKPLSERKSDLEARRLKVQTALANRRAQVVQLEERLQIIDGKLAKINAALAKRKQG